MPAVSVSRTPPGPLAATVLSVPAILAPLAFLIALFPARVLALPLFALLDILGQAGEVLAFGAWFAICLLLLLAAIGFLARALALAPRPRRVFIATVWLWAVLPNVALIVLFATAPD